MTFEGQLLQTLSGETVLEVLLRHHIPIGYSCLAGECLSCTVRCVAGSPPPESQEGLTNRMVRLGHFKACQCPADKVDQVARACG
ncbi:MAG: 2Fe-2S iron-sulfur cluster binding domain-containing protein [Armatimonadetes bacterium]|nr:2Fe-2S iron-sulfur cluster binding domain-containing protein [Armatimonadota bacterium]MBS1710171.1 2Fe-2S iron-sulfur cluster binding domain-containing protein [Armatimonadota bacterium]MBX3110061.1 2Fe-2S iron-sulfur cluster binding domain-containing protein [Fimbriimonadaceae bacterium]